MEEGLGLIGFGLSIRTGKSGCEMKRLVLACVVSGMLGACASGGSTAGERPPQGVGAAGTDFGRWVNDAEGAVDAAFRAFVTGKYDATDLGAAHQDLQTDGFECRDGNRPDGRPVPELECIRMFQRHEDVHAWSVEFWPSEAEPRARYTRTRIMDPLLNR